jgi:hypothetical protein
MPTYTVYLTNTCTLYKTITIEADDLDEATDIADSYLEEDLDEDYSEYDGWIVDTIEPESD